MSHKVKESSQFRGRYNNPLSYTNLGDQGDDFPEFDPYDHNAMPRSVAPSGGLNVDIVDMCLDINKHNHYTDPYDIKNLVIRRGQVFYMKVTFNRPVTEADDFQVEFLIGRHPSASKGTMVVVTFGNRKGGPWAGKIMEMDGESVMLEIKPTANAPVGKFRTYVAVTTNTGIQRTKRNAETDLYLLFNAWCPDDAVFYPNEAERFEYVLNDIGCIYSGVASSMSPRYWLYGQFEHGILDACIQILDASRMPIANRGDAIKLVRMGSAMINAQDDNGVCVGNWGDDFSMGKPPTSWTGSVQILLQYINTGVPVCYAQCWVFAGVFNTLLRCLGIPSRVVTNFSSAHDNTGNLKTDLIFNADETPDTEGTTDSIWNYHCWNEVYMIRPDLPAEMSGWQVVDSTPQEMSDGNYRCGPCSVAAIKDGLLCHPFDSGFVFAEVNSDVVYYKKDKYGTLTPWKVETAMIGLSICTKAVGSFQAMDITQNYKYPEGSRSDEQTMARAEEFGCVRDHSELAPQKMSVSISCEQVSICQDVKLAVDFQNGSDVPKTVLAHLSGAVTFYTGIVCSHFKDQDFTVTIPANQTERVQLTITAEEYMPHLGNQLCLQFIVSGQADGEGLTAVKVIALQTPNLTMTVSGLPKLKQEMFVTVSFKNPYDFNLLNAQLAVEGPGLMSCRTRSYSVIEAYGSISWVLPFTPRMKGARYLVAVLCCENLCQIWGALELKIEG